MPRIDALFGEVASKGGSDLHVAPGRPPFARVKGALVTLADGSLSAKDVDEMLDELLTPQQRARLGIDHSLAFACSYTPKPAAAGTAPGTAPGTEAPARARGQIVETSSGKRASFRIVARRAPALAELGCPESVWQLAERRSGLVLVAGPAGAGKTTTLAAMIDHINKTRACHVVTVEDPIEIVHEPMRAHITQREVGLHASSVAAALKVAARENADVIMVSSLGTKDAIREAVALANAGLLVLAALPASGVVSAVDKVLLALDDRAMLADALAGAVAQQLLGDLAVHEVLVASDASAAAIREGKTRDLAQGMLTFDLAFERLMQAGKLDPERALELSFDKEAFSKVVGKMRPDLVDDVTP